MSLLSLILLVGCPWIGPELHEDNLEDGPDPDPDTVSVGDIPIDGVEPSFSPTGVSSVVDVIGGPFEPEDADTYAVFFGERRARVVSVAEDAITVEVPVASAEGLVEVTVLDDDDEGLLPDAFRYYTNNEGLGGLFGYLEVNRYVTGSWPTRQDDWATAYLAFLTPTVSWSPHQSYAPRLDACRSSNDFPQLFSATLDDATLSIRSADGESITLARPDEGVTAFAAGVPVNTATSTWSIAPIQGGPSHPSIGVDPVIVMPGPTVVTLPLLTGDAVLQNSFYVEWQPTGQARDFIAIIATVYDPNWSAVVEQVTCAAIDDGRFRVTPAAFSGWREGNNIELKVGRVRVVGNVLEHDNSANNTFGVDWVVGPVVQR